MKLSAIVITKDEEENIGRCLDSLAFADETIVVDSESQDRTTEIAKAKGATVFTRTWPGYGPQKNFGASQAKGQWLLFIDADEEVTPELAQEITSTISNPTVDFYWLKIVTVFLGKPLHHMYGHNPRLFKKTEGQWTDSNVHEQVETLTGTTIRLHDDKSRVLNTPLLHHSHKTISSYLQRMHTYTTLDAKQMHKTNKHRSGKEVTPSLFLPFYLAIKQFLKLLLYKKGIFDGYAGLMWAALSGYYEYVMARKYIALTKS